MEVLKFLYSDEHIGYLGDTPLNAPFPHLYTGDIDLDSLLEGETLEKLKGKNLEALFKLTPAGGPELRSEFDLGAKKEMHTIDADFIESDLDVNSFLRELKEKEEIRILNEKGAK